MLGYVIAGPVLALLVSMKFTDYKAKQQQIQCELCCDKIESVEEKFNQVDKQIVENDQEMLKKVVVTIGPIAKAVKQLQDAVGV